MKLKIKFEISKTIAIRKFSTCSLKKYNLLGQTVTPTLTFILMIATDTILTGSTSRRIAVKSITTIIKEKLLRAASLPILKRMNLKKIIN
jgi:hypothetical protein